MSLIFADLSLAWQSSNPPLSRFGQGLLFYPSTLKVGKLTFINLCSVSTCVSCEKLLSIGLAKPRLSLSVSIWILVSLTLYMLFIKLFHSALNTGTRNFCTPLIEINTPKKLGQKIGNRSQQFRRSCVTRLLARKKHTCICCKKNKKKTISLVRSSNMVCRYHGP